ncbi:venom protease-like [Epargyreus clarus]|uniref:venom protease-like n=1 Tax=Epargyreus clarus TaxID=520877 RepID=UPI003C2AD203
MSREQQEQWVQYFPCDERSKNNVPGFSTIAKGDYVCCPRSDFWGISEDKTPAPRTQNAAPTTPNRYDGNNYPFYNPSQPMGNGFSNPQNGFFNNNNNYDQCILQHAPPKPESGCCGVEFSDGFTITDLERFLPSPGAYSNWGSQQSYPRYPTQGYERKTRETEGPALNVIFEDRIAGGREADMDQFPWTAFIKLGFIDGNKKNYFVCGGSLISSRIILSAAHCFVYGDSELDEVEVTLAEYDTRTFPRDCVAFPGKDTVCIDNLRIPVDTVLIHPTFDPQYLINDIALVRLVDAVPYTRYIRPICLPPVNIDSPQFANLPLATAGWGLNVSVQTDIKQFTVVQMVPKNVCKRYYSRLYDGHLCASGRKSEDTCKGDSGGPLMMMYQGKYYLAGIVSGKTSAYECGTPVPSLYTNVFSYLNWIRYYTG